MNKLQAALRAGYSKTYASKNIRKVFQIVGVQAAIDAGREEISKRAMISQDEVIRQLVKIGFANMGTYAKWGAGFVTINKSEELTDDQLCAVSEIVETITEKGSTVRLKLHPAIPALLGILDRVKPGADDPQKVEITHKLTYFPPEPKTMAEYEALVAKMKKDGKECLSGLHTQAHKQERRYARLILRYLVDLAEAGSQIVCGDVY